VRSVSALHALAAQKMPQLQNHLCRHAAEKPAIHARRSKTNPSNSQTADEVTIGRIEPKVCCRGEEIKKRSIFEDCESRQRGRGHSWLGPVILARQYSREARLAQLAPSVEHQTQVVARGALVQFYFRQEGWRAHT
jgi:hypothetical protein